ncbi:MAG TPA: energy transducer TonB [Candidatus Eremiobacteraceae bacterium]
MDKAPRDIDLQIQAGTGGAQLRARTPHLQYYRDEDAYDDVLVFDRPSQDVTGVAVVDTVSGDVVSPCTSPEVRVEDQVAGLNGWDIPTVNATFSDAGAASPDAAQAKLFSGRSTEAKFTTKPSPNYPLLAQSMDVSGKVVVIVQLGPAGQLESAHIGVSSGFKALDSAAMDAVRKSAFSGSTLDGIPIVSTYKIIYEFRMDDEPMPPEISDLLKTYCPAILDSPFVVASLNSGTATWYEVNLSIAESQFDSIALRMTDSTSHANDLLWTILLRGYFDTMGAGRDISTDYASMDGALFWPGAALTSGTVQTVTEHLKKSATCRPYLANVQNKLDSDSLVAVAQTDRPWLTAPIVETVLPARFATVSWPQYAPAVEPPQPLAIHVSIHVSASGEPLVAVVHDVSDAPAFSAAALNAAMQSTYVVPHTADGAPLTQTFDINYLYVPAK